MNRGFVRKYPTTVADTLKPPKIKSRINFILLIFLETTHFIVQKTALVRK